MDARNKNELPILACVSDGNDIIQIVLENNLGAAYTGDSEIELADIIERTFFGGCTLPEPVNKGKRLFDTRYASKVSAEQLLSFFGHNL